MPVVPAPTDELMPRIEMVVMPSNPGRTMIPGIVRVMSSTDRAPRASSIMRSYAVMLIGTSWTDSERR